MKPNSSAAMSTSQASDINEYVQRFKAYNSAILEADPSVRVMAVGPPARPFEWNRDLFQRASVGFLASSIYTRGGSPHR
jgi:hypothetical protein